jgi:hypothetical protein
VWQADSVSVPVHIRPRRIRAVSRIAAAACVLASIALAAALSGSVAGGPELFGPADRVATVGLGVVGALAVLALGRPAVTADQHGVRVRNIVGGADLPWNVVRAVRFDRGVSCASLELHDDDLVMVQAVQAVDKEHAVAAIRELRRLHADHQSQTESPPAGG